MDGNMKSGVMVATMTRSSCAAVTPAMSRASIAALVESAAVVSLSFATCRWPIPVMSRIHLSDVSMVLARSSLVTTFSGTDLPQPTMCA